MPSNVFTYGVDADNDGRIDLFVKADALYSIANYLREHGWGCQMDKSGQHKAIYAYNHSVVYANTILAVAEKLKDKPGRNSVLRRRSAAVLQCALNYGSSTGPPIPTPLTVDPSHDTLPVSSFRPPRQAEQGFFLLGDRPTRWCRPSRSWRSRDIHSRMPGTRGL